MLLVSLRSRLCGLVSTPLRTPSRTVYEGWRFIHLDDHRGHHRYPRHTCTDVPRRGACTGSRRLRALLLDERDSRFRPVVEGDPADPERRVHRPGVGGPRRGARCRPIASRSDADRFPSSGTVSHELDVAGSSGRTRTYDLVVNSHPLYQLSYRGTQAQSTVSARGGYGAGTSTSISQAGASTGSAAPSAPSAPSAGWVVSTTASWWRPGGRSSMRTRVWPRTV